MRPRTKFRSWHKQRVSSGADAALFFLVFVGGSVGIFWMKQKGYEQLTITAVPCVLLILYAAAVAFVRGFRLREDQAGDNCYYLGFLFTLLSLSLALAAFAKEGGTEEIVEDFGIALASTIFGLVLRVAFNQMRQDPVEVEREARLELAAAAQRLRSELDQSVVEMNTFRRATQQSIADGLEEFNIKVGGLLEKNLERYDKITSGSAERIDRTLAAFAENAQRLNGIAETTAAAIEALTERIEAIKAPENLIETKFAPATVAVGEMVAELRQRADAESQVFRELRKMIEGASAASLGLEERIATIAEVLKGASAASLGLEERIATIAEVLNGLKRFGDTLEITERRLDALTNGLDESGKALASGSNEWREAAAALAAISSQAESLREIEAQLKRLPAVLEDQIAVLARLREESGGLRRFFSFRSPR